MSNRQTARKIADDLRNVADQIENLGAEMEADNATTQPKPAQSEPEAITLETVRALLADKAREGKREAVKALITKFGAKKLTDVPMEQYAELFKEAEGL